MTEKEDLFKKIRELEEKLNQNKENVMNDWLKPADNITPFDHEIYIKGSAPVGFDKEDTIKQVNDAKSKSIERAGLVKNTSDGSVLAEDYYEIDRIPKNSIHDFDNLEICICECHNRDKIDCLHCYDHPTHLDRKRKPVVEKDDYDEAKIRELIEQDKAKKQKKPWWRR